jgi:hypothetical protein
MMGLKAMVRLVQSDVFHNEACEDGSTQISREIGRRRADTTLYRTVSGSRVDQKPHIFHSSSRMLTLPSCLRLEYV